jgi:hypothetical protein
MKYSTLLAGAAVMALGLATAGSAAAVGPAAETMDGGVSWTPGYETAYSVAVAVYGGGTIFDNPYVFGSGGDCSFSTTCAATVGRGDDFAAQSFTVTSSMVATSASFTELDLGTTPTDVNWGFVNNDGPGGLPGTFLSAGEDVVSSVQFLGTDGIYNVDKIFFNVGPQALDPGTYYLAIQAVSPTFYTYLGFGAGQVRGLPEPATWALMLVGVGAIGGALRRRERAVSAT